LALVTLEPEKVARRFLHGRHIVARLLHAKLAVKANIRLF